MTEASITAKFKVTAIVGKVEQVVMVSPGATIKDVWSWVDADVKQTVPVIRGRVADWLTNLVPGTVIHFV